jgi:dephospho-CoA kinase
MGATSLNPTLKVGLTGGIGSGKTTVSNLFEELKVPIIDADRISRESVKKGQPAYDKILKLFGRDVIDKDGELRRDYLRTVVFNNAALKKQLESVIHPEVRRRTLEMLATVHHPYCIISVPLLIESGLQHTVDRILVVDVPEQMQISRACTRDSVSPEEIMKIIRSQASREERLQQADDIISNDGDIHHLKSQVEKLNEIYLKLSGSLSANNATA